MTDGNSAVTNGGTNTTTIVNKVAARIPPFWKDDLDIWFAQVEGQFATSGITSDETKYNAILAAVDGTILKQVKPAVVDPPATEKYANIKSCLLAVFEETEQSKLRKLLSDVELGDRKPSQLLNEMRDLGGDAATETLLYTLWVDRLPTTVVAVLESSQENLVGKSVLADKLMAVLGKHSVAQMSNSSSTDYARDQINSINNRIDKLSQQLEQLCGMDRRTRSTSRGRNHRGGERNRSKTPYKTDQPGDCYYHRKFGDKARKCSQPCSFAGKENKNPKN